MTFDDFSELVKANRSCRRFDNSHKLNPATLKDLVDLARQTPSAANMQPLKYMICTDDVKNEAIFSCLGWAAYLTDWPGPVKEERPTGYIVILGDTRVAKRFWCDHGITAQTMLLGARTKGLAGCIFGAINMKMLKDVLDIEDHFEIKLVLAIGKPVETARMGEIEPDGDIRYYRDAEQIHHVPKRKLSDIIIRSW